MGEMGGLASADAQPFARVRKVCEAKLLRLAEQDGERLGWGRWPSERGRAAFARVRKVCEAKLLRLAEQDGERLGWGRWARRREPFFQVLAVRMDLKGGLGCFLGGALAGPALDKPPYWWYSIRQQYAKAMAGLCWTGRFALVNPYSI